MHQRLSAWRRTSVAVLGMLSLAIPGAALHAAPVVPLAPDPGGRPAGSAAAAADVHRPHPGGH